MTIYHFFSLTPKYLKRMKSSLPFKNLFWFWFTNIHCIRHSEHTSHLLKWTVLKGHRYHLSFDPIWNWYKNKVYWRTGINIWYKPEAFKDSVLLIWHRFSWRWAQILELQHFEYVYFLNKRCRRGRYRMVVEFTTIYAISAYHH
jgi:hypothetical protein